MDEIYHNINSVESGIGRVALYVDQVGISSFL